MNSFGQLLRISLLLHFRNRLASIYSYVFPVLFLAVFWVLYRHEPVPILRHLGQLLTVTILGSACFGLPTTLVSERELGVWRRYRLTPGRLSHLITSTVTARLLIIVGAGALQVALAILIGMNFPSHPGEFIAAFVLVAFALIGVGLTIAAMADNVPAVQALGQCIFLPVLILGGVAVPLSSLPDWAEKLSAFFPGRYAVAVLQACTDGEGLASVQFDLTALAVLGTVGCFVGTKLFRWDGGQRFRSISGRKWLVPALVAWLVIGLTAPSREVRLPKSEPTTATLAEKTLLPEIKPPSPPPAPPPWSTLTAADIAKLNFDVPPDNGVVTPIASPDATADEATDETVSTVMRKLADWPPAHISDPVQRVLNVLSIAAVTDMTQDPAERFLPLLIFDFLEITTPHEQLPQILAWIVLHPEQGKTIEDLSALGLGGVSQTPQIRERANIYALKFIIRLNEKKSVGP